MEKIMEIRNFKTRGREGFAKKLLSTAIAAATCISATAMAEDEPAGLMDEIIVVGTAGGAGVKKLDASFAISTLDDQDIIKFSPKSTADLFKMVPGVWSESSGGVSGANVFVRGFPSPGDAEFVTVQLQGSPIYPPSTLSFLENSTLFRIDETIERVEALRGGPNPTFSNGQVGLTTNFTLKEGSEETEGLLKYTTSDYDLQRVDAVLSGEISDDLYYMIGGYVSRSPGIRDTEFNSEEGRQFTINLTKEFENGKVNVYHRNTDDHGTWYLPIPIGAPGVDAGEFTYLGNANRFRELTINSDGDTRVFDMGDGRGFDGHVSGGSIEFELGNGWTLRDRFNIMEGDANTRGLVTEGSAVPVSTLGGTVVETQITGRTLGADDFIQAVGFWVVDKEIDSVSNELSLSKEWESHTFTIGYYQANFSSDDWWSIDNEVGMEVRANAEIVVDAATGAEIACADIVGAPCSNFGLRQSGDATSNAFYIADTWFINEVLTLDAGVRHEQYETEMTIDTGPGFPDEVIDQLIDYDESETSGTIGLNWALNEDSGVFGRVSTGSRFPTFNNFRDGDTNIREVDQLELGYKLSTGAYGLFVTLFYNEYTGAGFTPFPGAPLQSQDSEAYGAEIDFQLVMENGFNLSLNATLQETELTNTNPEEDEGNEAQRQPGWQLRVTPSYDFEVGGLTGTVYGTLSAVDDRFSDQANAQVLDSYEKVDLGVLLNVSEQFTFQVSADNITDEEGLTEGDPRVVGMAASNARPILGRSFKLSAAYHF